MQKPGMVIPTPGMSSASVQTQQAYTENHRFLVRLKALPNPVPLDKYFSLQFSVYDAGNTAQALSDASLDVTAGMQHSLKEGFAHGMQSAPRTVAKNGVFAVSGMYFHMAGPWTLKVDVTQGDQKGTAYFTLPCCGQ